MRTRWRTASAAGAAAMALVLTACGGSSSGGGGGNQQGTGGNNKAQNGGTQGAVKGGVLNLLGSGDVDYMDPNVSYYSVGYLGLRMWSRQLYTFPAVQGQTTTAVPDLASSAPQVSSDGLTVTIPMRSGVKWNTSPPRAVVASDVLRGLKRTCNPAQPFGGLPDFQDLIVGFKSFCSGFSKVSATSASAMGSYIEGHQISGVTAPNDTTVVFKLTHPAAYFKDMLVMPAFSPAPKEFDQYIPASAELAQHTLSDGPYYVASYNPTKLIDFKRNPAWTASTDPIHKAYVDEVKVDETVSQESAQQQLETNTPTADMEWDDFPPPSRIPALLARKDPNLNLGETASITPYLVFNEMSPNANKAMTNVAFRQAMEYGINRSNLVQALGGPTINPPLTHVLPPNLVGGEQNFNLYPYNPTKAKQLLQQAGLSNVTLKFLYRSATESSRKSFSVVQQDLAQIGIKVQGVGVPTADFYTKYLEVPSVAKRGVWDIAATSWGADWFGNGALSYFNPLLSGPPSFPPSGSNFGYYNSAATNNLISQAVAAKTNSEAANLWHQADMQTMKDAPIFPITNPKWPDYHAKQVHNAVYIPQYQDFDPTNVWLDKSAQSG